MTDRLPPEIRRIYYTEPACRTFDATVARSFTHDGHPAVTLDRTAFYPTSGGQPFDTGTLGDARVLETLDHAEGVVHVLSRPVREGAPVRGEIDWPRRVDHMQQHTGQHVLSAAFDRVMNNPTLSFHIGAEISTIDLEREVPAAGAREAEDLANLVVWENRPVTIRFVSASEAAELPLRKEPARDGTLRLIDIAGFDLSACGGTHVAHTGEIGAIVILGRERFKGGSRVTFACGGRALRSHRGLNDAVSASVSALSVLPSELPAAIGRLQAEGRDQRKVIQALQASLAVHEGASLVAEATEINGVRTVIRTIEGWDQAGLKQLAVRVVAGGGTIAVLFTAESPSQVVVARSPDVACDAGGLLKRLIERFGGKGGGRPDLAQGGGLTGHAQEIAQAASQLLTRDMASRGLGEQGRT